MRLSRDTPAFLPLLPLLIPLASAVTLDCKDIRVKHRDYKLWALRGAHTVHDITYGESTITNFTFTIDLCSPLKHIKGETHQCPSGTRVCGLKHIYDTEANTNVTEPYPIAGSYHIQTGHALDPSWELLKDSPSSADSDKEGLRLALFGGQYPFNKKGTPQMAYVEFLCDPDRSGNRRGTLDPDVGKGDDDGEEDAETVVSDRSSRRRRAVEGDDEEGDGKMPDPDKGADLQFVSYKDEGEDKEKMGVLRLKWRTKWACEGTAGDDDDDSGEPSGHWGFFTWFIIILFLGAASYLIFGSWLNYTRYGARGWDLIPHGDTIRDIPYIAQDWGRRVVGAIQGPGPRGGYSAV